MNTRERLLAIRALVKTEEGKKEIEAKLPQFPKRHRQVLEFRFGLNGNPAHTYKEVGNKIRLTASRAREVERVAIGMYFHPEWLAHVLSNDSIKKEV